MHNEFNWPAMLAELNRQIPELQREHMSKRKSEEGYQSVNDDTVREDADVATVVNGPKRRGRTPANPDETKADKFRRLANKRVPAALKRIQHVANLANIAQYEWSDEQRDKIVKVLQDAIAILIERFMGRKAKAESFSV